MQPRLKRSCAAFSAAIFVISMLATAPVAVAAKGVSPADDPDQPPVGLDIPHRKYLSLREHQVALYRGFPFTLPYNARQVAINKMLQQQRQIRGSHTVPATTPAWTPIGPAPIPNGQVAGGATNIPVSGRVTAIAVDPTDANIVYVGTAQGGLYRTTNAAAVTPTWTPLMDTAASLAIGAVAVDPLDHTKVFVGTGEGNFSLDSFAGVGLYRIINANGVTPTLQGPFEVKVAGTGTTVEGGHAFQAESITSIAIDPIDDTRMFVGSSLGFTGKSGDQSPAAAPVGLYFSDNAQATTPHFSRVSNIPGAPNSIVSDVMFAPTSSSVLLVGVEELGAGTNSGLYRSSNAGTATIGTSGVSPTFTRVVDTSPNVFNIKLAANKVSGTTTVLAAIEDGVGGGRLIESIDGGATFPTTLSAAAGFCDGQCYYDIAVAIDPGTAQNIYLGGSADDTVATQFELSTDGGTTFNVSDTNLHADTHAIAVAPSNHAVIYTGNDGGIFRSANSGATWTSLNTPGFSATQFQSIAVHPTNANFTIGGTQDNGTEFRNGAGAWTRADYGDGGFSAIDQNAANTTAVTMYHTYFNRKNNLLGYARVTSVAAAFDGNWTFIGCQGTTSFNGIGCGNDTLFYAPLALGPGSPNTVYFGTDRLYRSADSGDNNVVVGSNVAIEAGVPISAIGVAHTNDNVRIVGLTNGDVYRTTNLAPTSLVNVTGGWLPNYIARAVIDPTNRGIAYVTLDGFTGGTSAAKSHVWKTISLGAGSPTWTSAGAGIPDVPVNAFVIDPNDHLHLFAGTDIGVYESTDGATSWHPFGTGLPIVAVFDLAIASPGTGSEVLRAATHGKGMWNAPITSGGGDVTPPTAAMSQPSLAYNAAKPIALAWSGNDGAGSGVATFDVRYRRAKFNTTTFSALTSIAALQATASTSSTFNAAPGYTYCFSVRARDNASNTGSYSSERCTMVPIDDKAMTHSSGWTQKTAQAGDYLGTISLSTTKGRTLTITGVRARQIGLMAIGCVNCGKVTFTFGGKTWVANLNQAPGHYLFETTPYASIITGTLTIKIKSTTAAAHKVQIDGLVVLIKGSFPPSPPPSTHVVHARQV